MIVNTFLSQGRQNNLPYCSEFSKCLVCGELIEVDSKSEAQLVHKKVVAVRRAEAAQSDRTDLRNLQVGNSGVDSSLEGHTFRRQAEECIGVLSVRDCHEKNRARIGN